MKKFFTLIIALAIISISNLSAANGDTVKMLFHSSTDLKCYGGGERVNLWSAYNPTGKTFKRAYLKITLGCGSQACCVWDYIFNCFIMKKPGTIDSSFVKNDTISTSPLVINKIYKYFDKVEDYELGRLITPYGTYMENGSNGFNKSWKHPYLYDITDYLPLIKDSFGIGVITGGWDAAPRAFSATTEIFLVEGTSVKTPKEVKRVYFSSYDHATTEKFDTNTRPFTFNVGADVEAVKFRATITGHGSHGEFTPHTYYVKVNGTKQYERELWNKKCDEVAVAPQGGTWIFPRANWCPGEGVLADEWDLTPFAKKGQNLTVDIDMEDFTQTTGANYQIYADVITYTSNIMHDASLEDIVSPTNDKRHLQYNPICKNPIVKIKNQGKEPLKKIFIDYWIDPSKKTTYKWTGFLKNGESVEVTLPALPWNGVDLLNPVFHVELQKTGDNFDNTQNDKMSTTFDVPTVYNTEDFKLEFKTTNNPAENYLIVRNEVGDTVVFKKTFTANTAYTENFNLPEGCYSLEFYDYDPNIECGDGLSFWFSNQAPPNGLGKTAGYIRLKNGANNLLKNFSGDFGRRIFHQFTTNNKKIGEYEAKSTVQYIDGNVFGVGIDKVDVQDPIQLYPNPAYDFVHIDMELNGASILRLKDVAGNNLLVQKYYTGKVHDKIDLSDVCAGIYFIEIESEGKMMVRKVVVE